jgi:hypothetical protein
MLRETKNCITPGHGNINSEKYKYEQKNLN